MNEILMNDSRKADLVSCLKNLEASCGTLSREQVVVILGQWFHPLHYFPTFLSRLIAVSPGIETKTFISRILWQELGEGDPHKAHEKIYIETVLDGGFARDGVSDAPPFEATQKLVAGYEKASDGYLPGLGFLYGTEVVDLPMVATIGELMRRCTGKTDLPWVNVHVAQEPDHIESSTETLKPIFTNEQQRHVIENAQLMWALWIGFFNSIKTAVLT